MGVAVHVVHVVGAGLVVAQDDVAHNLFEQGEEEEEGRQVGVVLVVAHQVESP